jgi:hypothetical protein
MRMLNSQLYRKNAIQQGVPLKYTLKYYWRSMIGTCVAWFLYGELPSVVSNVRNAYARFIA